MTENFIPKLPIVNNLSKRLGIALIMGAILFILIFLYLIKHYAINLNHESTPENLNNFREDFSNEQVMEKIKNEPLDPHLLCGSLLPKWEQEN